MVVELLPHMGFAGENMESGKFELGDWGRAARAHSPVARGSAVRLRRFENGWTRSLFCSILMKPKHYQDDDVFEVEEIRDTKMRRGRSLYLIKWSGYDSSDNTWEPANNINADLVRDFVLNRKSNTKPTTKANNGSQRLRRHSKSESKDSATPSVSVLKKKTRHPPLQRQDTSAVGVRMSGLESVLRETSLPSSRVRPSHKTSPIRSSKSISPTKQVPTDSRSRSRLRKASEMESPTRKRLRKMSSSTSPKKRTPTRSTSRGSRSRNVRSSKRSYHSEDETESVEHNGEKQDGGEDSNDVFIVEKILRTRVKKGSRQWFVKWQGYSSEENTWEPKESFASGNSVWENFERDRKNKRQS